MTISASKLLVALDVPTLPEALQLVELLRGRVDGFKVGLELCHSAGTTYVIDAISAAGGAVFLDIKLKDIPNTVAGAVRAVARPGVHMLNVHCDGGLKMMRAAVEAAHATATITPPLVIGVTLLTSLDETEFVGELGLTGVVKDYVLRMASLAREAGLNGVVASPREAAAIKRTCGEDFLVVTPGIRPAWAATHDQQRSATPAEAARAGADYLVLGRAVTAPPADVGSPVEAVERIVAELTSYV